MPTSKTSLTALAPLFFLEPHAPHTHWTLCLSDGDSPIELFEDEGHSGNGYSWDSVARIAIAQRHLDADAIRFGSEGGTFVAQSDSLDTLVALAEALLALLRDEAALRAAIRAVPADDWDA